MYVDDLNPGMLLELGEGFCYYMQKSRKSSLFRLRTAPDVVVSIINNSLGIQENQNPIMYLGETSNYFQNKSGRSKLRTVMVDGTVAYIEGREFRNFSPIFA